MPDAMGHSWAGLGPRSCRFCGAVEGTKAVREPCEPLNDPERRKAIGSLLRKARANEKGVFPNA